MLNKFKSYEKLSVTNHSYNKFFKKFKKNTKNWTVH